MKKRLIFLLAVLLLPCSSLAAQDLETGYFLGGNPYAFRMNPAFQSERSIFSIALGQTGLGAWSNLGFSTLLYPDSNGYLYTFMNDRVNTAEFMRKIHKTNSVDADVRVNVLTLGFWSGRQFFTFDVNVRSLNAVSAPYDVFSFLKEGTTSKNSFDFSGMGIQSKTFIETAFGWSKNYDDVFNVGFRAKALVGVVEAEVMARKLQMTLDGEHWEVRSESVLNASSPSLSYTRTESGELDFASISLDDKHYGPAGYGAALDLGASWNVLPFLTLSAAILDLGPMRWNREIKGISPESSYTWAPSGEDQEEGGSWEEEIDQAAESLSGIFKFKEASSPGAVFEMLPYRVNLGAEFRMPFYDRLSVGALYQGRGGSCFVQHSGRLSLNWNPLTWMSFSTGTTVSKLGESIGFAFNLHPAGINLLLGCDYIPLHVVNAAPLFKEIPADLKPYAVLPRDQMKLNLYIGLNLAFGRRHVDHAKRYIEREVILEPEPDVYYDQDGEYPEGTPDVREIPAEAL